MPNLPCRGAFALAAVGVALLWTRPAAAQVGPPAGHGGSLNNFVTGAYVEMIDQAHAERHLGYLQSKLQRDAARGNAVATERDARWIARTRFRIGVDQWLIRYNTCQVLSPYPDPLCLDPQTYEAISQYRRLPFGP